MAKFKFIVWLYDFLVFQHEFLFEWDDGNSSKSLVKHGIECDLVESVFRDPSLLVLGEQIQPYVSEARYGIIGKAHDGSILFICFTIRKKKIRPISSRVVNQKERGLYGKEIR